MIIHYYRTQVSLPTGLPMQWRVSVLHKFILPFVSLQCPVIFLPVPQGRLFHIIIIVDQDLRGDTDWVQWGNTDWVQMGDTDWVHGGNTDW